jgi:hypothetical protein
MASEKLVDGDFLAKLLAGSFEVRMGAVEEAVANHSELFGAEDEASVRVIGTYTDHAIVANTDGEFFRCEWTEGEDGVTLTHVRQIDVPVIEGEVRQSAIRKKYEEAVSDLLECNSESAEEKLRELLDLATGGVPMTAEAVETVFLENRDRFADADWAKMVSEREAEIRKFLGAEALRLVYPKPQFENITGDAIDESVAEGRRESVVRAMGELRSFLGRLREQTLLARQVNEGYRVRGSADDAETTADFVEFASGFAEDLDGMISIVDDAVAVAEDGCAKCLARLHDGIAGQMREWSLAAAFTEKMARRFESKAA